MRALLFPRWARFIGLGLLLAAVPFARAADNNQLSHHDQKFMKEAAIGGLYEVQVGQLAQQKASSDQVKQLGERLMKDHSKANDQLKAIAQSKGVDLPTQLDQKHQRMLDRLSKLSGEEFDHQFTKMSVTDHRHDIKAFQKEAQDGKDADVKQFAAGTVPVLKEHLAMSETGMHASADNGSKTRAASSNTTTGSSDASAGQSTAGQRTQ